MTMTPKQIKRGGFTDGRWRLEEREQIATGKYVRRAQHAARMGFNLTSELTGNKKIDAIIREAFAAEKQKMTK